MLHLHVSNRFEVLADALLGRLGGPRADVLLPDTVVVPGSAMQRALSLALADRAGVCANVSFEYLARWLWRQVASVTGGVAAESPFDAASLTWRAYAVFGEADFLDAHPRLAAYLRAPGADAVMRLELAAATARLLEAYVTYRPDWLAQWQQGRRVFDAQHAAAVDEAWQAALWQRVAASLGLGTEHPLHAMARALEAGAPCELPAQVHLFALPAVPPLYLGALQALSRAMDIHLYALNPCREYWFDLVDARRLETLQQAGTGQGFEVGHPLLASWGKAAQSSLGLLAGIAGEEGVQAAERFEPAGSGTLLARLQDALLDLQPAQPGSLALQPGDHSVEVHACHSLTRELEVLHDRLLALFAKDASLQPSDVLVVTPDLDAAAPLVDAVFGTVPRERWIPYALTGRARTSVNAAARAFMEVLSLAGSRCTATAVVGLLQQPVVARRFGLADEDVQQVHGWLLAAGIHWGLDGEHVAQQGVPAGVPHTLADGLDRLYLGYALADDIHEPFGGRLPCSAAEGTAALPLGGLADFAAALRDLHEGLGRLRPPAEWAAFLHQAADGFLAVGREDAEDLLELHAAVDELAAAMARGGLDEPVPAAVVRTALAGVLDDPARGGVPTGRVTFTGMSTLRNLPFRVVCAIGLDDGAFPTAGRPAEFDLMAARPRQGDRQRGVDQRNQFLDLVLAARWMLYLSYTGRSIRDNAPLPPSVLVSELLEHLVPAIASDGASLEAARKHLVVEHPLQPFSPECFAADADPRQRSFDGELAQALRASLAGAAAKPLLPSAQAGDAEEAEEEDDGPAAAQRFFPRALAAPDAAWRQVDVQRLVEFFRHPARFLLRRRLRVDLAREEPMLSDDEPFLPDFDGRSRLAQRLLPRLLEGASVDAVRRLAQAGTELPQGAIGAGQLEGELRRLERFAAAVRDATRAEPLPPQPVRLTFDLQGEAWQLEGAFTGLRPRGLVAWRYDDERPVDVLDAWIRHLLLCAQPPAGVQARTCWVARDGLTAYEPVAPQQAHERLRQLLALYRRGLAQPLDFAPKAAWALVQTARIGEAVRVWRGSDRYPGESARPGYALAFRGAPGPLHGDFDAVARQVFGDIPRTRHPIDAEMPA